MKQAAFPSDLNGYAEAFAAPAGGGFGLKCLGVAATAAAIAGVVLPMWPTTPFALLAAWAFARSSPRLEARLLRHPRLGPPIRNWRERRAIPRSAKVVTAFSLPASWAGLWLADTGAAALVVAAVTLGGVGAWVLSRPG